MRDCGLNCPVGDTLSVFALLTHPTNISQQRNPKSVAGQMGGSASSLSHIRVESIKIVRGTGHSIGSAIILAVPGVA